MMKQALGGFIHEHDGYKPVFNSVSHLRGKYDRIMPCFYTPPSHCVSHKTPNKKHFYKV